MTSKRAVVLLFFILAGCAAPAGHNGAHGAVDLGDYIVRLHPLPAEPMVGEEATLNFTISRRDGKPVEFDIIHEKPFHVMIIRDDLQHFAHIHADGPAEEYALPYVFPAPGNYRVMAEFSEHGQTVAVPFGVKVPGDYAAVPLAETAAEQKVGGYAVALNVPDGLRAEEPVRLLFSVKQDGRPMAEFENFLGEKMHLAVWQEGLKYFEHAHPLPGPKPAFRVEFPEPGLYKLVGQFKHRGVVRTAEFVVKVT